jgi:hypothetical protein
VNPLYRRTFVGRENETRQLHQAYDAAVSGQGGLVMVVGEPGIGKTALCEQLATYVQLRGGKTLVGHCYEEGSLSLPYLAFVEAMRSYVLARDPEGLRSDLGTGAAEVARIVSEVRDRVQGVELRDPSDPEDDRWRLLNAVSTFLRNAASVQPLVIVLEDLHWADRGTLDLLLHGARNLEGARLLIVGTYRDVEVDRTHPLSATLADLRRVNTFLRVPLRGLTVDEVHRMYEAIRGNDVPWGQAEAVHRQTEGNPLFVQEVLRYLVEEGIVVREDGRYVARTPGEGVPEGLRDVVGRRLGHLAERTNQILSIASVIGRDFRLDVLQAVAALPEDEVLQALEEAAERSIIEQRPSAGSIGFRFTHAFFRQVLYEEIFAPRRIRWHQQVGHALEEVYARRLDEHAAELAEHFSQSTEAADLEKAVRYGELAAQRAMGVFAYGEAVRHLEQALRAQEVLDPEDKSKRCDLLLALGAALNVSGMAQRVRENVAPEALALAEAVGDAERASAVCQQALTAITNATAAAGLTLQETRQWAEQADRFAAPESVARVQANVALALTQISAGVLRGAWPDGRPDALELLRQARELARHLGDNGAVWTADVPSLQTFDFPGNLAGTLELAREVSTRSKQGAPQTAVRQGFMLCVHAFLEAGLRDDAERLISEAAVLADRTKDPNLQNLAMGLAAIPLTLDGRLEDVAQLGRQLVTHGADNSIPEYSLANVGVFILPSLEYLGDLTLVAELHDNYPDQLIAIRMATQTQSTGRNLAVLDAASSEQPGGRPVAAICTLLHTALALGHKAYLRHALAAFEGSEVALTGFGAPAIACVPRLLGEAAAILEDAPVARQYYATAMEVCQEMRDRPDMALARLGLAELLLDHYPEERDAAIEHLDFAVAELRDMKMQPALERALGRRGLLKA